MSLVVGSIGNLTVDAGMMSIFTTNEEEYENSSYISIDHKKGKYRVYVKRTDAFGGRIAALYFMHEDHTPADVGLNLLGEVNVHSNILISDPCYCYDTDFLVKGDASQPLSYMEIWGGDVYEVEQKLRAWDVPFHSNQQGSLVVTGNEQYLESIREQIFDIRPRPRVMTWKKRNNVLYDILCSKPNQVFHLKNLDNSPLEGVVVNSGIGDGCYELETYDTDQDETVGFRIVFLSDRTNDEDECDDSQEESEKE